MFYSIISINQKFAQGLSLIWLAFKRLSSRPNYTLRHFFRVYHKFPKIIFHFVFQNILWWRVAIKKVIRNLRTAKFSLKWKLSTAFSNKGAKSIPIVLTKTLLQISRLSRCEVVLLWLLRGDHCHGPFRSYHPILTCLQTESGLVRLKFI